MTRMEEGRKRALAIVAGILVARHLNTAEEKSRLAETKSASVTAAIKFKRCHAGAVAAIQRSLGLDKAACRD
jgi:hypothetical protein